MAQLKQTQLRYVASEDRLLLRVNTTARSEFRFWITRRYAKTLAAALARLLATDPHVLHAADSMTRRTILAFQHETALHQAHFSQRFEDRPADLPLGVKPTLLARLRVKRRPGGQRLLCLYPLAGQGVELALTPKLLHGLTRLLADAVTRAQWDLDLAMPPPPTASPQQLTLN